MYALFSFQQQKTEVGKVKRKFTEAKRKSIWMTFTQISYISIYYRKYILYIVALVIFGIK